MLEYFNYTLPAVEIIINELEEIGQALVSDYLTEHSRFNYPLIGNYRNSPEDVGRYIPYVERRNSNQNVAIGWYLDLKPTRILEGKGKPLSDLERKSIGKGRTSFSLLKFLKAPLWELNLIAELEAKLAELEALIKAAE